ncbi:MAG: ABC transporter permease [Cyclobacteriaceae bacterium]|nr:ABC transporter permease [Cyclobacteriaceae bacterium]
MSNSDNHIKPPRLADWLLKKFTPANTLEEVQGDLLELYKHWIEADGLPVARQRYTWTVLRLLRPLSRKNLSEPNQCHSSRSFHHTGMIQNYFKIAWRTLRTQWQYSLINITGLAVGMACCILILLYVRHEQSYDRYHDGAERIYRVIRDEMNNADQLEPYATTPGAMALTMRTDLPELEAATALFQSRPLVMTYEDRQFYEDRLYGTDTSFFSVFSFPLVQGSLKDAFATPKSILITETTARKYFGSEDPIGKPMRAEDADYFVTGVLKDVPANSHFIFDILVPLRPSEARFKTVWGPPRYHTYIKLKESINPVSFEAKVIGYAQSKYERRPLDKFHLQPLTDIHLHSKLKGELGSNNDISVIQILITIALFVIFMAGINYINLATARSTKRAKEVGIRKTSGALQRGLIFQFLTESILIAMLAFAFAVVLIALLLHPFNQLAGKQLELFQPELWLVWLSLAGLAVVIGIIAGLYPAVYLSSFNPVRVLKASNTQVAGSASWLRKALVCLQFTISTCLIIGTTVVISQMNYIGNKHPGFDKEHVIVISNAGQLSNRQVMEQAIAQLAGVKKVGASSTSTVGAPNWTGNILTENSQTDRMINLCQVNYDYLDALGIQLLEGRQFSLDFPADTINTIILNEAAVRDFNLADPIGQQLRWDASSLDTALYTSVVGVVSDFHFASFHEPIKPFAFLIRNNFFVQLDFTSKLFIKTSAGDLVETVRQVEEIWKEFAPQRPFSYTFLDDNFKNLHADEERFKVLFSCLTGLGIFIVCLGMFGLIAFVTEQRTKEIGIRKVLGASVSNIVLMLNKDFMKLVTVSLMVASPISIYFMNQWLEDFSYRISLSWWMFALAGLMAALIVLATTGYQSIKASLENPVKSLRAE